MTDQPPPDPDGRTRPTHDELRDALRRLHRLSWISLAWQSANVALLAGALGGSQVVTVELAENALVLLPPVFILVMRRFEERLPDEDHPFGYRRAGTVAFLGIAFVLAALGVLFCGETLSGLLRGERPSIGGYTVLGRTFWHGWLMMAVLALTAVPPVFLGRAKLRVAAVLYDKPLHSDADVNQAGWLGNAAGVVGLLLVAFGFWWGDSAAALLISLDILHDGVTNVRRSLAEVMDKPPTDIERQDEPEEAIAAVNKAVADLPFVEAHHLLLREHGRVLIGEVFIRPRAECMPPVTEATRAVRDAVLPVDWRLRHLAVEFTDDPAAAAGFVKGREQ